MIRQGYSVNDLLGSRTNTNKNEASLEEVTIENFKSADKSKLMETFLMHNEIINFVFDNIFRKQLRNISDSLERERKMRATKYSFKDSKLQTFYSKNAYLSKNITNSEPNLLV